MTGAFQCARTLRERAHLRAAASPSRGRTRQNEHASGDLRDEHPEEEPGALEQICFVPCVAAWQSNFVLIAGDRFPPDLPDVLEQICFMQRAVTPKSKFVLIRGDLFTLGGARERLPRRRSATPCRAGDRHRAAICAGGSAG